jgi:hypothetical protein
MKYSYIINYMSDEGTDVNVLKRAGIKYPHLIKTEKDLTNIEINIQSNDDACKSAHIVSWHLYKIRLW